MIIFRLSGGFGNQLFSFAAGYQVAKGRHETNAIDTSTQEAPWFFRNLDIAHYDIHYDKKICYTLGDRKIDHLLLNHIHRRAALGLFTPTVKERNLYHYDPDIFNGNHGTVYYIGDWQCPQYFAHYEEDIRRMFIYHDQLSEEAAVLKQEIINTPNSVAVYARRGDYVQIGISLDQQFYRSCVMKIAEQVQDPVFYLFSEDPAWIMKAMQGLPYSFRLMDYASSQKRLEDFELMRNCHHQIVSNSTYSWWAAWLNENPGKIILRPNSGARKDTDFWPENWQIME